MSLCHCMVMFHLCLLIYLFIYLFIRDAGLSRSAYEINSLLGLIDVKILVDRMIKVQTADQIEEDGLLQSTTRYSNSALRALSDVIASSYG